MGDTNQQFLDQAINTLSQSDPIMKLLQQVKLGRMQPTDAGLRAITDSWLETYRQVLRTAQALDPTSLRRLDPSPRLNILIDAGVLPTNDPGVLAVRIAYEQMLAGAQAKG